MHEMKGVTPVIAVILLLLITIAIVGFAFIWFTRVATTLANATEQSMLSTTTQASKKVAIDNIDLSGGGIKVSVRNIGSVAVTTDEINVYVDSVKKNCGGWSGSIAPSQVQTCDAGSGTCTGTVKVTAGLSSNELSC